MRRALPGGRFDTLERRSGQTIGDKAEIFEKIEALLTLFKVFTTAGTHYRPVSAGEVRYARFCQG
jgi:hypothetical protein